MPNSYATVPNILPGNVTIGGNLTVGGDQIRIGAASPFTRIAKIPAGGAAFSYNFDNLLATTDAASQNLAFRLVEAAGKPLGGRYHDGVGGQNFYNLGMDFARVGALLTVTGTVAETDLLRLSIRGGFLQAFGGLRIRMGLVANVQGAVASTFRLKLGATTADSFTKVATANILLDWEFTNSSNQATQRGFSVRFDSVAGVTPIFTNTAENMANTLDLAVTLQPGAVGDSWSRNYAVVEPVVGSTT